MTRINQRRRSRRRTIICVSLLAMAFAFVTFVLLFNIQLCPYTSKVVEYIFKGGKRCDTYGDALITHLTFAFILMLPCSMILLICILVGLAIYALYMIISRYRDTSFVYQ